MLDFTTAPQDTVTHNLWWKDDPTGLHYIYSVNMALWCYGQQTLDGRLINRLMTAGFMPSHYYDGPASLMPEDREVYDQLMWIHGQGKRTAKDPTR